MSELVMIGRHDAYGLPYEPGERVEWFDGEDHKGIVREVLSRDPGTPRFYRAMVESLDAESDRG